MSLRTSRFAAPALLLAVAALLAGCVAPQESGTPTPGAGDDASLDDTQGARPTLPAFDRNATARPGPVVEGEGNQTTTG